LSVSLLIFDILFAFWIRSNKKNRSLTHESELDRKHKTEEKRLRSEFPAIFAFIESVGEIHSQKDFDQFVGQLNHLLEIERRARGIKWSEVKDIEAMKAIAYARLIAKRNSADSYR
jgi:hypothetical protein